MRGTPASFPIKNTFKRFHPQNGTWGMLTTSTPKEQSNKGTAEEADVVKEKSDPIVAFSRPPPLPPVLGPLLALSVFQTWSSRDSNDD